MLLTTILILTTCALQLGLLIYLAATLPAIGREKPEPEHHTSLVANAKLDMDYEPRNPAI